MLKFLQKERLDLITTCETEIEKLIQQNLSQDETFQGDLQKAILDLTYEIREKILDENTHTYEFIHYKELLLDMNSFFENLKKQKKQSRINYILRDLTPREEKQESQLETINNFSYAHIDKLNFHRQLAKPFIFSFLICTILAASIIFAYVAVIDLKKREIGPIPLIFVLAIPEITGLVLTSILFCGAKSEIPNFQKTIGRLKHEKTCRPKIEAICNILKLNPV